MDHDRIHRGRADPGARILGIATPWSEIFVRMVTRDGTVVPVEVVGTGGVYDPLVNGVIYEYRSGRCGIG